MAEEEDSGCWCRSEAKSWGLGKMCHLHGHRHTVWEFFHPFPQSSRVPCMVGPKLCLCFYSSSLKIQCQKGHGHPSLSGKNKSGRDDGDNNSGSVLNSFCPGLTWCVCTHTHMFVCVWVCMLVEAGGQPRTHPPYFIESPWGLRLAG